MNRPLTPEELCTLIDTQFSTLLLYARQWTADEAEDLVQDAFLELVKRSARDGRPENPVPWLFQVVRNGAIDRHRKHSRRRKHEDAFAAERSLWFETAPDAPFRDEEIAAMLESLDREKREVLVARIWGALTFDEIAALLDMSRTTVFRHYTEALQSIRKRHGNETS